MVNDMEARNAVRQLMKRFELIAAQGAGMAFVLAKRNGDEYARLLDAADIAVKTVIQPVADAEAHGTQVYAALDDPNADWPKAVFAMLKQGPIEFAGEQAIEKMKFVRRLEERFDAEMKNRNKSAEDKEPGFENGS